MPHSSPLTIYICQGQTCTHQEAAAVLAAFTSSAPATWHIEARGCLGQCGNGPMVVVLPEMWWYATVQPADVPLLCTAWQAGESGLARQYHPRSLPKTIAPTPSLSRGWLVLGLGIAAVLLAIAVYSGEQFSH